MENTKRGIVLLTNVERFGKETDREDLSKKRTGFDIREVAYLHHCLEKQEGWTLEYVSIEGGESPVDPESLKESQHDEVVQEMMRDRRILERMKNTTSITEIDTTNIKWIFIPGCHGAMMDIAKSDRVCHLACKVYENNGCIATISHGAAGLLTLKRGNEFLIKGKKITGFTDEEEKKKNTDKDVPFSLEQKLRETGARFEKKSPFESNVVQDERLITAQNPQSVKEWIRVITESARK